MPLILDLLVFSMQCGLTKWGHIGFALQYFEASPLTASGFLISIFSGLSSVVTAFMLSRFLHALLHAANTGEPAPIKGAIALFVGSYLFLLLFNLIHETIRNYMSALIDLEGLQLIFTRTFELGVQELEKGVSTIGLVSNALIIFYFFLGSVFCTGSYPRHQINTNRALRASGCATNV